MIITLPEMEPRNRRAEGELWKAYEDVRPHVLGALYDAVAGALARQATVTLPTLPRMADFAKWITAAEPALGWAPGTFMAAYSRNAAVASQIALDSSPISAPLIDFITAKKYWKGCASLLLAELNRTNVITEQARRGKSWPQTPSYLGTLLGRIAPDRRKAGFTVKQHRIGKSRSWEFTAPDAPPSVVVDAAAAREQHDQGGDEEVTRR